MIIFEGFGLCALFVAAIYGVIRFVVWRDGPYQD